MRRHPLANLDDLARSRIIQWRRRSGMTQADLGMLIGRSKVWVSRYENKYYDADLDTLALMAAAFGQSLYAVLDLKQDPIEQQIVECIRAIRRPSARQMALGLLRELSGATRERAKLPRPTNGAAADSRRAKPAARRG